MLADFFTNILSTKSNADRSRTCDQLCKNVYRAGSQKARFAFLVAVTIIPCAIFVELSLRNYVSVGQCVACVTSILFCSGATLITRWWERPLSCALISWEALNFHSCALYFLLGLVAVVEMEPVLAPHSDLTEPALSLSVAKTVLLEILAVVAPAIGFLSAIEDILVPLGDTKKCLK